MHSPVEHYTDKQPTILRPQLRDVVKEHLEEYSFLSMMRRKALFDPEIFLYQLERLDNRLESHWDGLVVGCPMSLDVAQEKIEEAGDPWDTYVALRVWFELGNPITEEIVEKLSEVEEKGLPPWREAFCRCPKEKVKELLPANLLEHVVPSVQSTVLFVLGWHDLLPAGQYERFVQHTDPLVRYCLARTISWGAFAAGEADQLLSILLTDEDQIVKRAALWSAAMMNIDAAREKCRSSLKEGGQEPFVVQILGLIGNAPDAPVLLEIAEQEDLSEVAFKALGALGSSQVIEHLLQLLDNEKMSAHAAQAIKKILGKSAQQILPLEELEARKDVWQQLQKNFSNSDTIVHGFPFPWQLEPHAEPFALHWRRMILEPLSVDNWIKKEIPEDFFTMTGDGLTLGG